jgi:hypothetical protein
MNTCKANADTHSVATGQRQDRPAALPEARRATPAPSFQPALLVFFPPCRLVLAGLLGAALLQSVAVAGEKSGYTLLDPVPAEQMREFNTDRPDKTESPYTVDAGHFQIEADLFTSTHDHDTSGHADLIRDEYTIAPMNLRVGVLPNVDFQLLVVPFVHERTKDRVTGAVEERSGFGDLTARVKVNLWGNDGSGTALGLLPFVKFPTSQDGLGNGAVEGGMIIPFAVDLPLGFGLGVMTEFDFNENSGSQDRHVEYINSITLDHNLCGKLAGYLEFFSSVSDEPGADWIGTVDLGLTYALSRDVQLDAGVNLGVTKAADDLNFFMGLSLRF